MARRARGEPGGKRSPRTARVSSFEQRLEAACQDNERAFRMLWVSGGIHNAAV